MSDSGSRPAECEYEGAEELEHEQRPRRQLPTLTTSNNSAIGAANHISVLSARS
jgi:hypothetical protein